MKLAVAVDEVIAGFGYRHFRFSEVCAELPEHGNGAIHDYMETRINRGTLIRVRAPDWRGVLYCVKEAPPAKGERFYASAELIDIMARMGLQGPRRGARRMLPAEDGHVSFGTIARENS